jgi:hypothetical protein
VRDSAESLGPLVADEFRCDPNLRMSYFTGVASLRGGFRCFDFSFLFRYNKIVLTYDFPVIVGQSNTLYVSPYTVPGGTLVGKLWVSGREDSLGTELTGAVTFETGKIVINISAAQATAQNFPGFYTITLSIDGGSFNIILAGRTSTSQSDSSNSPYTLAGRY